MRDRKRPLVTALALALASLALIVGGCISSPSPRFKPSVKIAAVVYPGGGSNPSILGLYRAALEVNKTTADYELDIVQVTPNDAPEGTGTMSRESPSVTALERAISQDSPDLVLFASAAEYDAAAHKGLLHPLDSLLRSDEAITRDDFFPGTLEAVTEEGQVLYGFPLSVSALALQYDRRVFDAAGVPYPDGSWNWMTFVSTLEAVSKVSGNPRTDQYGMSEPGINFLLSLIWQNGGEIVSKEGNRSLIAEAPAVEAIQFYSDLAKRYKVVAPTFRSGSTSPALPGPRSNRASSGEVAPLISPMGRVAVSTSFGVGRPGYLGSGYAGAGSERPIRLVSLPKGQMQACFVDVNTILSVTASSVNQRLAYKALLGLVEEMSKDVGIPTRRSLAKHLKTTNPYLTDEDLRVVTESLEHGRALPMHRRDRLLRVVSSKLFGPLQGGKASALDLARDTAAAMDDVLNGVESPSPSPSPSPATPE